MRCSSRIKLIASLCAKIPHLSGTVTNKQPSKISQFKLCCNLGLLQLCDGSQAQHKEHLVLRVQTKTVRAKELSP